MSTIDENDPQPLGADAMLEAIGQLVAEFEQILGNAQGVLPDELDRARVADATRAHLYNLLALTGWRLLDELYARDGIVFRVLREIEPEQGETFAASVEDISRRSGVPLRSCYAGLRRLDYLGLIRWEKGHGQTPARLRLDWTRFRVRDEA